MLAASGQRVSRLSPLPLGQRKVSSTGTSSASATEVTWLPEVTRTTHTALSHSLHVHITWVFAYQTRGAQSLHAPPYTTGALLMAKTPDQTRGSHLHG